MYTYNNISTDDNGALIELVDKPERVVIPAQPIDWDAYKDFTL